ncbi:aspartate aminotransferase family protein [Roseiflexus castenholzii]|jgi:glutamate-1-semialdehyde 2,1-aminomutase|uniref:Aminotransferase class-III n=1 Tax=Roseiflexus castenholzii (strain DSM 13941 / HLO8) TaxID=383372 RepID=A7NK82_ROSCS|nr:aminotransferase class III-fold pyridoxal phosphate-dependent enzyme [Roseiflexus castenholzii]ABU57902.1 aminotransferase class-III [Roseiflexus castenholzii DSM 13941]
MTIIETYIQKHPRSQALFGQAQALFPSGVTHDGRYVTPFPLYVEQCAGAHKWDADENRLIDYWMGHGALLLGHGHPAIVAAVQRQMERGTHYGAEHELSLQWAQLVKRLVPGIERLRFTASGTEATMMALRLARAFTGKPVVLRFTGHYHGWHDLLAHDTNDASAPAGLYDGMLGSTVVAPTDLDYVEQALRSRTDIAAVILEPTGASYGAIPLPHGFLRDLRQLTWRYGVLLICDEIVTGFRVAPGGAQQRAGVTADLTTLAKILAGGLPGGAVGGRADILRHLAFGDAEWNQVRKIRHFGTFNAAPLSAAAGTAMLGIVANDAPGAHAATLGERLITGMNAELRRRRLAGWAVYGDASIFHIVAGCSVGFPPGELDPTAPPDELKRGGDPRLVQLLRLGMINHGVDLMRGRSGFVSAAHTPGDIDATIAAFATTLDEMVTNNVWSICSGVRT